MRNWQIHIEKGDKTLYKEFPDWGSAHQFVQIAVTRLTEGEHPDVAKLCMERLDRLDHSPGNQFFAIGHLDWAIRGQIALESVG